LMLIFTFELFAEILSPINLFKDNLSSLLQKFANYDRKNFNNIGPRFKI
jgi:hypothetical protein